MNSFTSSCLFCVFTYNMIVNISLRVNQTFAYQKNNIFNSPYDNFFLPVKKKSIKMFLLHNSMFIA